MGKKAIAIGLLIIGLLFTIAYVIYIWNMTGSFPIDQGLILLAAIFTQLGLGFLLLKM